MADARRNGWSRRTGWPRTSTRPDLVILDGSMHLPTAKRDAKAEYLAEHIPGALFFDIDDIADEKSPLPHMLPSADQVRQPHEEDGHRRRHARRRLRQRGPLLGGARVVDVPRHGPRGGARCSTAASRNGRPRAARSRTASRAGAPSATSPPGSTPSLVRDVARREGADRQQGRADRRCPRRRPLRGHGARAAPGPALRPHPGLAQRALRLAAQCRRHAEAAPPSCARSSPRPASIRASPWSPPAARASPPA